MVQRAFILSLFAFLGLVISVSATRAPSEESAAELDLNAEFLAEPLENTFRVARSSEKGPKKKSSFIGRKKLKRNKGKAKKGKSKKGKSKKDNKRRSDKKFKRRRKNNIRRKNKQGIKRKGSGRTRGRKAGGRKRKRKKPGKLRLRNNKKELRQTCDEKELCKRIKLYIKYSNQQTKAKRILRSCKTMKSKADKAETAFKISSEAILESGDTEVETLKGTLAACAKTAKATCALSNVDQCADAEQAKINACVTKLKTWLDAFGPGTSSCLGQENCCACINALSPAVPDECLNYDAIDKAATGKKLKCTKNKAAGGSDGSFGECRKQQYISSVKGPEQFKLCKKGKTASAAMSGRRMVEILALRLQRK